jgi:Asp-tRNA(Asn)/Glu-tRNA(Gln) amidotransferase A subunit family amidase
MTPNRRDIFRTVAAAGIGSVTFQKALAVTVSQQPKSTALTITPEMIEQAEWVSGIKLSEEERKAVAQSLNNSFRNVAAARKVALPNSVAPAVSFNPAPAIRPLAAPQSKVTLTPQDFKKPANAEDIAFLPVAKLAQLIRTKQITSTELTKLYLDRLKKYDPALLCVVTLTEELALKQAAQADAEIAAGKYRGPLHGIPWGAKDLIAYPGYKTTWGAEHFKNQEIDVKATVAKKLEEAGAVLVAKLTLGALALGDNWFGGMTRNPWNNKQGSSGSSAGSASAVAAGLVGFAIGSETQGSILSPSRVCGVTGLRPTFGRVSRHGCMTLSWSMDKLGPLTRSAEDCAIVLGAIHGFDGLDAAAVDQPFEWPSPKPLKELRVGIFGKQEETEKRPEIKAIKDLGVKLVPVQLPSDLPIVSLQTVLDVETAAAFDNITLDGVRDGLGFWATTFRRGRFIPAVDYLRALRIRTLLMERMQKLFESIDLYIGGNDILLTNQTGHPTISLLSGFSNSKNGPMPQTFTMTGSLYGEADLLHLAHAFQEATGHHLKRPNMEQVTPANAGLSK